MSLQASVNSIQNFMAAFAEVGDALDMALTAEAAAKAANKRVSAAEKQCAESIKNAEIAAAQAEKITADSAIALADAQKAIKELQLEAKAKADAALSKAKAKLTAIEDEAALAAQKFAAQKETNDEILAMLGAQIAHGEAKLQEVRDAIAAITKA